MSCALSGARLFTHGRNSAGERVRIALRLKGMALPCVDAPTLPREVWLGINPQGLMPALVLADGRVVAQATAILELIEEVGPGPPLLPADPVTRALARGFAQHIASDLHPVTVQRIRRRLPEPAQADWVAHWTATALTALEAMLARRPDPLPFCYGTEAGWADLHLLPQLRASARLGCDLSPYPLLRGVAVRCDTLPAFDLPPPDFGS
ncbi:MULTISPECIES: glutathione S-transferase N-terminal domain-containing protein [Roseomonadaceae]|uniref:Glutathione S-transferase N-terminal domain-containing protein n=1 Tax=Falsiroseomonas oleicola TaxID=2801474 RepID=A0ABS6H8R5_9PROT|nr:glutathione S-transferase N-terminal domain-containing protein [Roseomonas oleicola]MBU8545102.1 glutathione S-transferase N-terminal domain-containing protein [Roseomonas oleicola]